MKQTILNFRDFSLRESTDAESHAGISKSYMKELKEGVRKLLEAHSPIEIEGLDYKFYGEEGSESFRFRAPEFKNNTPFDIAVFATPFYDNRLIISIDMILEADANDFYLFFSNAYNKLIPITIEFKGNEFSDAIVKNADIANLYDFFISKLLSLNVLKPNYEDIWKSEEIQDFFNEMSDDEIIRGLDPEDAIFIATHVLDPERGEPLIRRIKLAARSKKMFGM